MKVSQSMIRQLQRDNAQQPRVLTPVPRELWPHDERGNLKEVWRSRQYLVQVFEDQGTLRISVNLTMVRPDGRWRDGLTWDELQAIKHDIGRGDQTAVEVYPADNQVINVANIRHLWLVPAESIPHWTVEA